MAYTLTNPGVELLPGEETRIQQLAMCKTTDSKFNEDRRSVYWNDGPTNMGVTPRVSDRQKQLALPKLPHSRYQGDRPSPIWRVSPCAMRHNLTPRSQSLACPKLPHINWRKDKPVQTVMTRGALNAIPTGRVLQLSHAKEADRRYVNPSISLENLGALGTICIGTDKGDEGPGWVDRLSNAKPTPKGYKSDRPVKWTICRATLTASAGDRIDELSKIRRVGKRNTRWYNFNEVNEVEDPYAVSGPAKKASASARVNELSMPIPRKMRQKKGGA